MLRKRPNAHILQAERASILLAMEAVRLGARRVTLCEPWDSLAFLYEMIISENKMEGKVVVLRKPFVSLQSGDAALEPPPEVLLCHNLDCGLFGYGLFGTLTHAWEHLLTSDTEVIPERAIVYGCPVELYTNEVNCFDLSGLNSFRWSLFYNQVKLGEEPYRQLAEPQSFLTLDFSQTPNRSRNTLLFTCSSDGVVNAIAFWYELCVNDLYKLSTAPPSSGTSRWHQALQYFDEPVTVVAGSQLVLEVVISSDGIRFNCEGTEELHPLLRLKPVIPPWHFPMIADNERNDSYERAICRAVRKKTSARVLDIGAGTGLLAMMAARAGAERITACECIPHMATVAQTHFMKNGFGNRIRLSFKNSKEMKIPDDMSEKANILVSETFDHSLLGEGFLASLIHARAALMDAENVTIIPSSATVFAMGIELRTGDVAGFDLSALNLFRYRHYQGIKLKEVDFRPLTKPFEAFNFNFYDRNFQPDLKHFYVPAITDGICNAIVFWYHLILDEETVISTALESDITAWDQAVIFLEQDFLVGKGQILPISGQCDLNQLQFFIEPLNFMLEGGRSRPPSFPNWFCEFMEEEIDVGDYTEAIRSIAQDEYPYITQGTFETLIARRTSLGFDPTLFSDFITQISGVVRQDRV